MAISLEPVSLDETSAIRVRFSLGRSSRAAGKILVVGYDGTCRSGDEGEADGRFMLAMGQAGLMAWEPDGIVLNLTELDCRHLTDGLTALLSLGEGLFGCENLPLAVVAGPRCERTIRPFFLGGGGDQSETSEGWSPDIAGALGHVEDEMARLDALFSRRGR